MEILTQVVVLFYACRSCFPFIEHYLYNNIVLSMLYAEICPNVRRHNARPEGEMLYAEICPKVRMHYAF